ncbi:MAG: pilus assembly protein PilM [Candidatus Omnitrophica bacterium]|nr:pilus assembly protein PilM [Candidatus Omnitrophota bacterium]MCM8826610.1 pilus assembly protein PilM [Candidatus Omnitrophota bacterium]
MKLFFKDKLDRFIKSEENEFVCLDLGSAYTKGVYIKEGAVKSFFIERSKGEAVNVAIGWIKKEKLVSKPLRIAIKGQETLIRYIPFPKVEKDVFKESLGYEISKFIPFKKEDIYYDADIVDDNYSSKEFLIILALCKKNLVDNLINRFNAEKINVTRINLSGIAILNSFLIYKMHNHQKEETKENVALVDIGNSSTIINLIKKGIPCLSREVKPSSKDFIHKIADLKNCSWEEAENFIKTIDAGMVNKDNEIINVMEETVETICDEIRSSLDYFEMNWGERIERIYLSGGIMKVKLMESSIVDYLGKESIVWSPLKFIPLKNKQEMGRFEEFIAVLLGLSL